MYDDSITYNIDLLGNDSLSVTIFKDNFPQLSFPKDAVGNLSPQEVRTFIEVLKVGQR